MTDPLLLAIGARLEKIVSERCRPLHPPSQELFDEYEQAAIQILDSEYIDFPEGRLEAYLTDYLARKRSELGLDLG